jgi:glycosyltransferase involved in cell wall biosynthesis
LLLLGGSPGANSPLDAEVLVRGAIEAAGLQGRVLLTGPVADVERYLQASDIFVYPSELEAFGGGLTEAMTCGLPVVCSHIQCGSADYMVERVHGLRFAIGDAKDLQAQLTKLLANVPVQREMGIAGRALAKEQVSMDRIVDDHEKLFMAALSKRKLVR